MLDFEFDPEHSFSCAKNGCDKEGYVRYSLGIYAGRYCDEHWAESGYRKERREGFSEQDAGERYEEDEGDLWP